MFLRLINGPMLEKSNRTGPLADRQIVLLTARLRLSLFLGFSTTRETRNFQKISREFRKSSGFPGFGKFPGNFSELDYFDIFLIFNISDLYFSILLRCFDKLSLSFSIFSTN